jgi:hypothetical protein
MTIQKIKRRKTMEINIKPKYKIELDVSDSDVMKIGEILKNTLCPDFDCEGLGCGRYLIKLSPIQLEYILKYFLEKNE